MAHALARQGDEQIVGDPLPVPRSVEDLVADRLDGLSHGARDLVLAAAALSRPTASVLERAVPHDCDVGSALIEAEEAGVLVVDRERIRFAHPLLASVVYGTSSQERRRQLHELLADVVEDPEERARHLASSATIPTDAVATEIESAAAGAARRGAQQAAAELYAASARLTPPEASAQLARRRLGEATSLLAVGDMAAARAGADQAAQSDVPGNARPGAPPAERDPVGDGLLQRSERERPGGARRDDGRERARPDLPAARLLPRGPRPGRGGRAR